MTTIASIIAGVALIGATTVGVVHSVHDRSHRPSSPSPVAKVVPYGTTT